MASPQQQPPLQPLQQPVGSVAPPSYSQPPVSYEKPPSFASSMQPPSMAPAGLAPAPAMPPPAWAQPPPPAATASMAPPAAISGGGGGGSSPFFDNLLSEAGAAAAGSQEEEQLPPLPTYVGTTVAQGDTVSRLHATMAMAGRGVVLQIENRTKQILTLRSCSLNSAPGDSGGGGRWQIPPPSGVESEATAVFGATTSSAAEIAGRFTLVDAARHCYNLEFNTSVGGGIGGGGSARGKVSLVAVSTLG